jgi:hypothetical protein
MSKKKAVRSAWPITWQARKGAGLPGVVPNYGDVYSLEDLAVIAAEIDQQYFGGFCFEMGLTVTKNVPRRKKFDLGTRRLWFATYNEKKRALVVQPYAASRRFPVEMLQTAIFHAMLFAHTILLNEHQQTIEKGSKSVTDLMRDASFVGHMDEQMSEMRYAAEYRALRLGFLDWACSAYAPEIKQG